MDLRDQHLVLGLAGGIACCKAAELCRPLADAQAKRLRKGAPLLVGNIGPAAFGQDDNSLLLASAA